MPDPAAPIVTDPPADPVATNPPVADPPADPPVADPPADPPVADPAPTSWKESLGEEIRSDDKLSSFDSVDDLAKAYLDAPEKIAIPTAEEYDLPEGTPEAFREFANQNNLGQDQVNSLVDYQMKLQEANAKAFEDNQNAARDELFETWGDKKDANLNLAVRVIQQFDTKEGEMRDFMNATRAGNNPKVIAFLTSVGRALDEDGFLESGVQTPANQKSAAESLYPNQGK